MFQISRRADYAVRIMIELGLLNADERLPARKLARRTGVSKAFLHKITADLVKAQLVTTYAGPSGGLALTKPLADVDMLQIVEAVEGPICLNICLVSPEACEREKICPAHTFWGEMQTMITQRLREQTLDKLTDAARELRRQPRTRQSNGHALITEEQIHVGN